MTTAMTFGSPNPARFKPFKSQREADEWLHREEFEGVLVGPNDWELTVRILCGATRSCRGVLGVVTSAMGDGCWVRLAASLSAHRDALGEKMFAPSRRQAADGTYTGRAPIYENLDSLGGGRVKTYERAPKLLPLAEGKIPPLLCPACDARSTLDVREACRALGFAVLQR